MNREEGMQQIRTMIDLAEPITFEDLVDECANLPTAQRDDVDELTRQLMYMDRNDSGNASRLLARYGEDLLFIKEAGWYVWNGQVWGNEVGARDALKFAKKTARDILQEVRAYMGQGTRDGETSKEYNSRCKSFYKFATESGNSFRIKAMLSMAEPDLYNTHEDLDVNRYLFSVDNGTLDLNAPPEYNEDGDLVCDGIKLLPHTRNHMITRKAEVHYDPNASCPHFMKFLADIIPDEQTQMFLQRWFGYCMTGLNKEQFIVMFYGKGSNGKSTLMDLIDNIMGSYAAILPFSSLLHDDRKRGSEPTPDLARLPGVRYVTSAEPDFGAKFSESMIKSLTGGEKLAVRHLNKDFFEFYPQFKIVLSFNNKPLIRGQDHGIWRRILLVPFDQKFVDPDDLKKNPNAKVKDPKLNDALRKELPGILNWMLDGYRQWSEKGLDIPDVIRAATKEYKSESNPVGSFIEAWTQSSRTGISSTTLYDAYKVYCELNEAYQMTLTAFGRQMNAMDLGSEKISGKKYYKKVELTMDAETILFEKRNPNRTSDDEE
jgi:putative DNA primase/helicase